LELERGGPSNNIVTPCQRLVVEFVDGETSYLSLSETLIISAEEELC